MQQLLSFSTTLKALRIAAVCTGLLLLPGCSDDQKEAASDAWDKTKESTAEAVDATKEASSDAWDKTKEVSGDAWDKTKEVSGDAWDKTKDLASEPVVEDEQKVQIEDR
jgi:outer membrane murein-binding lipoprotein Lpp